MRTLYIITALGCGGCNAFKSNGTRDELIHRLEALQIPFTEPEETMKKLKKEIHLKTITSDLQEAKVPSELISKLVSVPAFAWTNDGKNFEVYTGQKLTVDSILEWLTPLTKSSVITMDMGFPSSSFQSAQSLAKINSSRYGNASGKKIRVYASDEAFQ